jgi:CelD/BcsL family acetyltransferase involved in cellulose biosynthesis
MSRTTAEAGALRLCFLWIDGRRASGTLSFADGDRWLLYNSGYDPEYRQQSVGLLLKAWSIRYAIENGFREYDFLRGDEAYKYDLGGRDRKLFRYVLER